MGKRIRFVIEVRRQHLFWEAEKMVDWLRLGQPEVKWTAASTAQEILNQAGLIKPDDGTEFLPTPHE
jgi:hypothetical protein